MPKYSARRELEINLEHEWQYVAFKIEQYLQQKFVEIELSANDNEGVERDFKDVSALTLHERKNKHTKFGEIKFSSTESTETKTGNLLSIKHVNVELSLRFGRIFYSVFAQDQDGTLEDWYRSNLSQLDNFLKQVVRKDAEQVSDKSISKSPESGISKKNMNVSQPKNTVTDRKSKTWVENWWRPILIGLIVTVVGSIILARLGHV